MLYKYRLFNPNYDCFNLQLCTKLQAIVKDLVDSEQLLSCRDVITAIACAEVISEKPDVDRVVRLVWAVLQIFYNGLANCLSLNSQAMD